MSVNDLPVLYSFRRCPFAMRARLALAASDTCCELREVVLRAKPADLLQVSPKGTVPVLVLPGGQVLEHSLDIMLWALKGHDPEGWLSVAPLADMLELIGQCDGAFKHHLDHYKYPERYPGTDPMAHRTLACDYLRQLDDRLQTAPFLFGTQPGLADRAIGPFVRQFAHTDKDWFAGQSWPALQNWLHAFLDSALFERVMQKYPRWEVGNAAQSFPPQDPQREIEV